MVEYYVKTSSGNLAKRKTRTRRNRKNGFVPRMSRRNISVRYTANRGSRVRQGLNLRNHKSKTFKKGLPLGIKI